MESQDSGKGIGFRQGTGAQELGIDGAQLYPHVVAGGQATKQKRGSSSLGGERRTILRGQAHADSRRRHYSRQRAAVANAEDLIRVSQKITKGKNQPVPTLVSLERDLADLLTVVKIGPEAEEKPPPSSMEALGRDFHSGFDKGVVRCLGTTFMTKGVRVVQVYPYTPAKKAGIRAGDLCSEWTAKSSTPTGLKMPKSSET